MNELIFEETHQKPTADKKNYESYEVTQITVKNKYTLEIECNNADDVKEVATSLAAQLRLSHRGIEKNIADPANSNTFSITGKIPAEELVQALAELKCISENLKNEIMKNNDFQALKQSNTPKIKRK